MAEPRLAEQYPRGIYKAFMAIEEKEPTIVRDVHNVPDSSGIYLFHLCPSDANAFYDGWRSIEQNYNSFNEVSNSNEYLPDGVNQNGNGILSWSPLYVGYSNNLARRFQEHSRAGGIAHWINNNPIQNRPQNTEVCFLYARTDHFSTGKALESLFLNTFNFALNSDENLPRRNRLDLIDPANHYDDQIGVKS